LFDGRRVYLRSVLLLVVALRQTRPRSVTVGMVCRQLGVARHTVRRWATHFSLVFARSSGWQTLRGRVGAQVRDTELPADVFTWLSGGAETTAEILARVTTFFATGNGAMVTLTEG
jgi:transposase-like protein